MRRRSFSFLVSRFSFLVCRLSTRTSILNVEFSGVILSEPGPPRVWGPAAFFAVGLARVWRVEGSGFSFGRERNLDFEKTEVLRLGVSPGWRKRRGPSLAQDDAGRRRKGTEREERQSEETAADANRRARPQVQRWPGDSPLLARLARDDLALADRELGRALVRAANHRNQSRNLAP